MQNRVQANEYRNTLVCIDSYVDGVLDGRLYHPQLHSGEQFHSAIQFLQKWSGCWMPQSSPRRSAPPCLRRRRRGKGRRSSRDRPKNGKVGHLYRESHLPTKRQLAGLCVLAGGRKRTAVPQRVRAAPPAGQRTDKRQPDGEKRLTQTHAQQTPLPQRPRPRRANENTDHGKPPERAGRKAMGAKALRHASPAASIPFLLQKMRRRTK